MIKNFFKQYPWLFWMIIIAAVIVQMILFKYKDLLHVDEIFTFASTNGDNGVFFSYNPEHMGDHAYSSVDFENYLLQRHSSFSDMWRNLRLDTHMPIYFVLLRLFYSFTANAEYTIVPAMVLNILTFIGLLFGVFCLFKTLFKDDKIALAALLVFAFCKPVLSMAVFLRMYLLWMMFVVYLISYSCQYLSENVKHLKTGLCILVFSVLQLLTHFYGFIFGFVLECGICLVLLLDKRYKDILIFSGIMLSSVFVAYAIFPAMIDIGLYGGRGVEFSTRLVNLFQYPGIFLDHMISLFSKTVFGHFGVALTFLILSGIVLFKNKFTILHSRIFCLMLVIFWGYGFLSALVQPSNMSVWQIRYFSPIMVAGVCLLVYLLQFIGSYGIFSKSRENFICLVLLILAYLNAFYILSAENPFWLKEKSLYTNSAYSRFQRSLRGADVWWGLGSSWEQIWQLHIFADKLIDADNVFVISDFDSSTLVNFAEAERLQGKYAYLVLPFTQALFPEGATSWVSEKTGRQSFYLFTFQDKKYDSFLSASVFLVAPY